MLRWQVRSSPVSFRGAIMRLVLLGAPGSGKGTQCQFLVQKYQLPHISTGEMLRKAVSDQTELGQQAQQYMASGRLVPDSLVLSLLEERLQWPDCQAGYLLDGVPRTVEQAKSLERMFGEMQKPLNAVIELRVSQEELLNRLLGRKRADDKPEVIRQRLQEFTDQTSPLVDFYEKRSLLVSIDGVGTPTEIFQRIINGLESLK